MHLRLRGYAFVVSFGGVLSGRAVGLLLDLGTYIIPSHFASSAFRLMSRFRSHLRLRFGSMDMAGSYPFSVAGRGHVNKMGAMPLTNLAQPSPES